MSKNYLSHIFLLALMLGFVVKVNSQNVLIDEFGNQPDNSAMLEIDDSLTAGSRQVGLLIPRMSQVQKNLITSPARGLLIYQLDADSGFHYNRGTSAVPDWVKIIDSTQLIFDDIQTVLGVGNDANGQSLFNLNSLAVDFGNLASSKLHINESAGSTTNLKFSDLNSGTGNNDGFNIDIISGISELRNFENGPLIFYTSNLERMRLENVGLAIDSSIAHSALDINGSARIDRLGINSAFSFPTNDGAADEILLSDGAGQLSWGINTIGDNLGNHLALRNIFLSDNYLSNDGDNEGLFIDTLGKAGIGLTELETKFTVYDPTFPLLRVSASTGGPNNIVDAAVIEMVENNPTDINVDGYGFKIRYVGNGSTTDRLQFLSKNNGTEDLVLLLKRTNRRVGIGVEQPEKWLDVVHSNSVTDGISLSNVVDNDRWHFFTPDTNGLEIYYNNSLVGAFSSASGAYFALSDRRAKQQIRNSDEILGKIKGLNIYTYRYNEQQDHSTNIGVLAQELQQVFPSLVTTAKGAGESERLTVNYFGLNALAAAATTEQYDELKDLEKRIERLEKKLKKRNQQ